MRDNRHQALFIEKGIVSLTTEILKKASLQDFEQITISDIYDIHNSILSEYGGLPGEKEDTRGKIEATIGRMNSGFGEEEFYKDLIEKTAILMHSLITTHPYVDGNKRTALGSGLYFLHLNGFTLEDSEELADLIISIAEGVASHKNLIYYINANKKEWNEEFYGENYHTLIDTHNLLT